MKGSRTPATRAQEWVEALARPAAITALQPVAARFIYSLRLVATYQRARRDPAPELAQRLGQFTIAIKSLQLLDTIGHAWPDPVNVRRFCCCHLSHDELTLGRMMEAAWRGDEEGFARQVDGLVRSERIDRIWNDAVALVMAEAEYS
ncbi:hypothetical protein AMC99_02809 [Altererythrobacter epoxidivorans]|uniref:Uncharacterized protein n=2 Tax=Altererythrobacter epoxidivorans TaxID=361183 RepID=A0A0M4MJK6_9SPHN|nr:hypothetical protein AMC99_02809 [Altererythrobacter epoxidivorans]